MARQNRSVTTVPPTRSLLALLLFASACGGAPSPSGSRETLESPRHRIVLHRVFEAGQRFRFTARSTNRAVLRAGATVDPALSFDQTVGLDMVATETIVATNTLGQASRTVYELATFDVLVGDERRPAATPGQRLEVVAAERTSDVGLTLIGGALDPRVRSLLLVALDVTQVVYTDDHVFGTLTPQAVGSWWSVDPVRLNEALLHTGQFSGLGELTGETTLVAMEWEADLPCARIDTELRIDGVVLAERIPNFTPGRGSLHTRLSACYPIDTRFHPRTRTARQDFALRGRVRGPNGYLPAELASHVEMTSTRAPLP